MIRRADAPPQNVVRAPMDYRMPVTIAIVRHRPAITASALEFSILIRNHCTRSETDHLGRVDVINSQIETVQV